MRKSGGGLRLAFEILNERSILCELRPQYLDCDKAIQQSVLAFVYDCHTTITDFL